VAALPLWRRPVSYAAIGATQARDLLRYPPTGYRPIERRRRIGHGEARFEWAAAQALTWGIQRNSGLRVRPTETPPQVSELSYLPVSFDDSGVPIAPATTEIGDEVVFGQDGTPFVAPGDTALVGRRFGRKRPVRVIYVINEPLRKGFACGTLFGHPESGEESWLVEKKPDDSVWITVRAFSRPTSWVSWTFLPILRMRRAARTERYLRALAGPLT
jgi:uncharacterized protein (UPF0548 family)